MTNCIVSIATKGRPKDLAGIFPFLRRQSLTPKTILVVATCEDDVRGLERFADENLVVIFSAAGLAKQRNVALRWVRENTDLDFLVFFDDDFRPHSDWLRAAHYTLSGREGAVGVTGRVVADGIGKGGVSEDLVEDYLSGTLPAQKHRMSGSAKRTLDTLYGCNMAYSADVVRSYHFDENLPAYGWQEDFDFSARARELGPLLYEPACRGVHLGTVSGREVGVRLGYSQIANPIYLGLKGTMRWRYAVTLLLKNIVANHVKSRWAEPWIDRRGRASGNRKAIADLISGNLSPSRIQDL